MPLEAWEECEKGNIRFVNKDKKTRKSDVDNWTRLYDEYLKRYGLGANFDEIIRIKKKLIYLRCNYILNGNKKILNQITIEEKKLLTLEGASVDGLTIGETLVHLGKWLGYRIDKRKITIVEYKVYLEEYERAHKKK